MKTLTIIEKISLSVVIDQEIERLKELYDYNWGADDTFMKSRYQSEISQMISIKEKLNLE